MMNIYKAAQVCSPLRLKMMTLDEAKECVVALAKYGLCDEDETISQLLLLFEHVHHGENSTLPPVPKGKDLKKRREHGGGIVW